MAFSDRYRQTSSRPSGPSGNIVVRSESFAHNDDKTMTMKGTVISGMGVDQKITLVLPEKDAKVIRSGLMKHAKPEGGEFYFTGVEVRGGKVNYRHLTLLDAGVTNPDAKEKDTVLHNVMMRPRVRYDRETEQVRGIRFQVIDPAEIAEAPAEMGAIIDQARAIFAKQIEAGRQEDGIGWLIHNAENKDTDFRTFTRRSATGEDSQFHPEDLETTVKRFAKEFAGIDLSGDPETDDEVVQKISTELEGYKVKLVPVTTYPVLGDTFGVEAAGLQSFLKEGRGFTKLGTHIFHQTSFARRLDILMNSQAIPDAAKEQVVENFKAQASPVAVAAFDTNGKFADVPQAEIGEFIRNVGFQSPRLGDGYGWGWGRGCIKVGAPDGMNPLVKVAAPTIERGTPLPYMEETRQANQDAYSAPKRFAEAVMAWDPTQAREQSRSSEKDEGPGKGAEVGANDLRPEDLE